MDPLTIAAVGKAASGIGSLASAFGLGRDKGPSPEEQTNHNLNYERKRLDLVEGLTIPTRVAAAKKAGLHPLSALGVSPSSGSIGINYDQSSGPDLEALGQGIDRALSVGRDKVQRQLDQLALEKAQLENDYLKTQIAGSKQEILRSAATPSTGFSSSSGVDGVSSDRINHVASVQVANKKGDVGLEAAPSPMWKEFKLDNDRSIRLPPNQSIDELGMIMGTIKGAELAYKNFEKYTPGYWLAKKRMEFTNKYFSKK